MAIDANDPQRLRRFWKAALGHVKQTTPEGAIDLVDPAGRRPTIWFQQVPEGKFDELRTDGELLPHVVHLDINVGDGRRTEHHEIDTEVQRLVGLGATVIRKHNEAWGPWPEYHYVMADPEGHVFCVQ